MGKEQLDKVRVLQSLLDDPVPTHQGILIEEDTQAPFFVLILNHDGRHL